MFIQRIRVRFRKRGELRAISHLDLMRAFERALRRSGLPLRMSEGFNPHPRLSFPAALGVGIEGVEEVMEFDLCDWVTLENVQERLREQLPEGLDLVSASVASPHETARVTEVIYRICPHEPLRTDARLSAAAVESLLARKEIAVERVRKGKEKSVNIRPFILSLQPEGACLSARLKAGPEGSVHPEEILGALGFDLQSRRTGFAIVRTRVTLAN